MNEPEDADVRIRHLPRVFALFALTSFFHWLPLVQRSSIPYVHSVVAGSGSSQQTVARFPTSVFWGRWWLLLPLEHEIGSLSWHPRSDNHSQLGRSPGFGRCPFSLPGRRRSRDGYAIAQDQGDGDPSVGQVHSRSACGEANEQAIGDAV